MKPTWIMILLMCIVACADRDVAAQPPFEDGFENVAAGDYPDENGWQVMYSGNGASVSDATAHTGINSFHLNGTSWGRVDYVDIGPPEWDVDRLTYEVSVYIPAGVGMRSWVGFANPVAGDNAAERNAFFIDTLGGVNEITFGNFYFNRPPEDPLISVGAYTPGTWATVRADLDFGTLQGDLWLNGELMPGGVPIAPKEWTHPEFGHLVSDTWAMAAGGGGVYFDEVTIIPWLDIAVDIGLGSNPLSVNPGSHGVIPVAILGGDDFDVSLIDLQTLDLAGAQPRARGNSGNVGSFMDINHDSIVDLLVHFETEELTIDPDTCEVTLTGLLEDGTQFGGADFVRIVPPSGDPGLCPPDPAAVGVVGTFVPEPATLSLLALGGLAVMRRKRK